MAIAELIMPKMGESIMEATILRWNKKAGDHVKQEETVLEIATDKVDSEVPSSVSGIIKEILFNVNDVVAVGTVIARIEVADTISTTPAPAISPAPVSTPAVPVQQAPAPEPVPYIPQPSVVKTVASNNKFFSPLVLNIANSEGLSLSELERIPGTGADGRVSKKDVLQYIADKRVGKVPAFVQPVMPQPVAVAVPTLPTALVVPTPVPTTHVAKQEVSAPQPVYIPPQTPAFVEPIVPAPVQENVQHITTAVEAPAAAITTSPSPVSPAPVRTEYTEPTPIPETVPPAPATISDIPKQSVEIIEMDRMRKLIAQHMIQSKATN